MELDNIKQRTTWNDASASINSNFMKVRQAILSILQDGGGSANIDVDTAMSDTSENAVANKVIKKYVDERAEQAYEQANEYTDEEVAHIEGVLNARIDSLEGGNVYNVYYTENNELSEEQLEANKKAYVALASEEKAAFYLVQEGNVYSRLIVSTTMKSASTEAIAVEAHIILPIGNKTMLGTTAINLYSDGHISMTVVQTEIPNMEEVWQEIDKKQDILVDGQNIKTINGESILGEGDITIEVGEGSEGSQKTYVFYLDEELTEEKIEANKSFYEAAISEIPASYVVSSYGVIAIPTMVAGRQDSVTIGITTNDEIADSEARDREYLDVRNLQIELVEDGTFTIYKQFDSRLAKVRMLDEVIAKVDEIPDLIANLPQGETFNYVHIPFEDAPLDEEQLAENAASCTKWLEAYKNNEPLPILCWSAFPYGDGRMHVYGPSDGLLNFSISTTLGFGNDESLDNAELVAMLIVAGTLSSSGEVELYVPLEEKHLTTINSFKTINGQSILGEGDIEIQGGGNVEVDAELSETSENAVSNKAVTMAIVEDEEVAAAALNELNKRFDDYATKEDIDATLAEMDDEINHIEGVIEATILEDEEVTAAALNDLDKRVTSLEQNGGGGNSGGGEGGGTSDITIDSALSTTSTNPVQNKIITTELNKKVDAVSGKGLSTNDYTTTEKNKLSGIASGAEVNVQSDWNATSGDAFIKNKPTFATINGQRIDQGGEITIEGGSGGSGGGEVSGDFVTRTEIVENESVIATALTDIDERLVNTDANIADNNNAIKQLNDTLEELNESIIENENVLATTLIDLRDRIQNTDDNLTQSNNEKSELAAIVEELISRVAENERVMATALTDLNERMQEMFNNKQ